jgi:hypothetical protein
MTKTFIIINDTPLDKETRHSLDTRTTARHLGLAENTLRIWSSTQRGPLAPVKVGNRLRWRTDAVRALLNGQHGVTA